MASVPTQCFTNTPPKILRQQEEAYADFMTGNPLNVLLQLEAEAEDICTVEQPASRSAFIRYYINARINHTR